MPREFQYTTIDDAFAMLSNAIKPRPRHENVELKRAYGRVLASNVTSSADSPMRDVSHFDGFALSSKDTDAAQPATPIRLTISPGSPRVGVVPKKRLASGSAMRISTGGYLPSGADAVVAVEDAKVGKNSIEIVRRVPPGEHVYRRGSDTKKGDLLLPVGRILVGQDLVLLASMHVEGVQAVARPRVAVVPTGSELTSRIGDRKSGKVVESHGLLLTRLIEEAGGTGTLWPIVPDDKAALGEALKAALRRCNLVFSLAGTSMGEPDIAEEAIRSLASRRVTIRHGIRVNRGRVMGVAAADGKAIVLFPGPIQAALNAFIVFGYPLIRRHLGRGFERPPSVLAVLAEDWEATGRFKEFDQVVYLTLSPGGNDGELLASPGSAETENVSFLVSKNAYALVRGGRSKLSKGERIWAHLLPGFSSLQEGFASRA